MRENKVHAHTSNSLSMIK